MAYPHVKVGYVNDYRPMYARLIYPWDEAMALIINLSRMNKEFNEFDFESNFLISLSSHISPSPLLSFPHVFRSPSPLLHGLPFFLVLSSLGTSLLLLPNPNNLSYYT